MKKSLVDLNVTELTEKDLKWADYVFVSAMIVPRESAGTVIQPCRCTGAGPDGLGWSYNLPWTDENVKTKQDQASCVFARELPIEGRTLPG